MNTQRDIFITKLFEKAKIDKNIILISVDMGAPSLDLFRKELPDQFISAGISEQFAINLAAGLSESGKKVYVYFMASWVARCFEQIRYSCALSNLPITILGNGVGQGYFFAGPAHNPNDDIAYMRSLNNIEILSPSNLNIINKIVDLTIEKPKLRYIRLERNYNELVKDFYNNEDFLLEDGYKKLLCNNNNKIKTISFASSGYCLGRAIECSKYYNNNYNTKVYDIWEIKNPSYKLIKDLSQSDILVTLEEQTLSGGFSSSLLEKFFDYELNNKIKIIRFGLNDNYIFENGTREQLLDNNGLNLQNILNKINKII